MTNETVIAILGELKKCYLGGIVDALDFAIEAVKAQEPRVMTLEEVIGAKPGTVVWLEDFDKTDVIAGLVKRVFIFTEVIDFLIAKEEVNDEISADLGIYGEQWRCWTSRPTDAQREATPW